MRRRKFLGGAALVLGGFLSSPNLPARTELQPTRRFGYRRRIENEAYQIDLQWESLAGTVKTVSTAIPQEKYHRTDQTYLRYYHTSFQNALESKTLNDISRDIRRQIGLEPDTNVAESTEWLRREYLYATTQIVQRSIEHQLDEKSVDRLEYPRNVHETLVDGIGDCGDKTSLLAGLLHAAGFDTGYVLLLGDVTVLHMATLLASDELPRARRDRNGARYVQIRNQPYAYAETTVEMPLGVVPNRFYENGIVVTYTPDAGFRNLDPNNLIRSLSGISKESGTVMT